MCKRRLAEGFTLIECLVVVVVIGVLVAIAMPNYNGAKVKAKLASVKSNMHTCQLCAEAYASDNSGNYPTTGTALAPYYPGGSSQPGGTAGTMPTNPFTAVSNEPLATSALNSTTAMMQARTNSIAANEGAATGQTGYVGFSDNAGTVNSSYSIVGGDDNAKDVMGLGGMMVLSNK